MKKILTVVGVALLGAALGGCHTDNLINEVASCPAPLTPATCGPLLSFENDEEIAVATFASAFDAFEALLPPDEQAEASQIFSEAMGVWNAAWSAFVKAVEAYSSANTSGIGVAIVGLVDAIADLICVIDKVAGGTGCSTSFPVTPLTVGGNSGGAGAHVHPDFDQAREHLVRLRESAEGFQMSL